MTRKPIASREGIKFELEQLLAEATKKKLTADNPESVAYWTGVKSGLTSAISVLEGRG